MNDVPYASGPGIFHAGRRALNDQLRNMPDPDAVC